MSDLYDMTEVASVILVAERFRDQNWGVIPFLRHFAEPESDKWEHYLDILSEVELIESQYVGQWPEGEYEQFWTKKTS